MPIFRNEHAKTSEVLKVETICQDPSLRVSVLMFSAPRNCAAWSRQLSAEHRKSPQAYESGPLNRGGDRVQIVFRMDTRIVLDDGLLLVIDRDPRIAVGSLQPGCDAVARSSFRHDRNSRRGQDIPSDVLQYGHHFNQ